MKIHTKVFGIFSLIVLLGGILYFGISVFGGSKQQEMKKIEKPQNIKSNLPIVEATNNGLDQTQNAVSSWPGEVISSTSLDVHSLSEGVLATLPVRVGQKVKKGEVIGTLSSPPASMERADKSAERMQMLTKARANYGATTRLVEDIKKQLQKELKALSASRESSIILIEKDSEKDQFENSQVPLEFEKMKKEKDETVHLAEKERDQARIEKENSESMLRAFMRQVLERDLPFIVSNTINTKTDLKTMPLYFESTIGSLGNTRLKYEKAFRDLVGDLDDESSSSLDKSSLVYAQAMKNLVFSTNSGEDVSNDDINTLRKLTQENQLMIIEKANEYSEKKNRARVKDAELLKMIAENEKEVTAGSIRVSTAQINKGKIETTTGKNIKETERDFLEKEREIKSKIIELDREKENALAEVNAAEIGYSTFTKELGSQTILAPKDGIISGIFKSVGEYIKPDDALAIVSDARDTKIFVRFRVPNDEVIPQKNDELFVIRPGFPFDKKRVRVVGSGTTLDANGSFVVEAEFLGTSQWPLHALVRVMPIDRQERIVIPFTALFWDEKEESHIYVIGMDGMIEDRVVQTGHAIGDRIEILDGLAAGEKYLSKQISPEDSKDLLKKGNEEGLQKDEMNVDEKSLIDELNNLDTQDESSDGSHHHGE